MSGGHIEQRMKDIQFSAMYPFVRGRQLEGTFPGDPATGIWPITANRIGRGWGVPPEDAWPYNTSEWPPLEPPGVDAIAKRYPGGRYQRVRTLLECKTVLGVMGFPVGVSVEITEKWFSAPHGRIPARSPGDAVVGTHSVLLVGYNDNKAEFTFRNSWGINWGDQGNGFISYEIFEAAWCEGWLEDLPVCWDKNVPAPSGVRERSWGINECGGGVFHAREFLRAADDEQIAWSYAVEREAVVEVEELFVRPQFRRNGYGTRLIRSWRALSNERGADLKLWVSFADVAPDNLQVIQRLTAPLGLSLKPSGVRWASLIASAGGDSLTNEQLRVFPQPGGRPRAPFLGKHGV